MSLDHFFEALHTYCTKLRREQQQQQQQLQHQQSGVVGSDGRVVVGTDRTKVGGTPVLMQQKEQEGLHAVISLITEIVSQVFR